jgi:inosine/xanthosine triphosphate pyrophosphatase family protein
MSAAPARIVYVTGSAFKRAENEILVEQVELSDGVLVKEIAEFDIRPVEIKETLEISIATMVEAEAKSAYAALKVPCLVEHAGLVFEEYAERPEDEQYPGGLTKPMWNALGEGFLDEVRGAGRRIVAKAVVGYCDGTKVHTFSGETAGCLAESPRGEREFYWDTVFVPDDQDEPGNQTYAELVASRGLGYKVRKLSQSTKAIVAFLEWYRQASSPLLWR